MKQIPTLIAVASFLFPTTGEPPLKARAPLSASPAPSVGASCEARPVAWTVPARTPRRPDSPVVPVGDDQIDDEEDNTVEKALGVAPTLLDRAGLERDCAPLRLPTFLYLPLGLGLSPVMRC